MTLVGTANFSSSGREHADDWVRWFWTDFLSVWIDSARDPEGIGYVDLLDADGVPMVDRKSILTNARLLFTFSHLALLTQNPAHIAAARTAREALDHFQKPNGLYQRGLGRHGHPNLDPADDLATSYDQSFVILGLSTWGKLDETEDTDAAIEACWAAIQRHLLDPVTGLLLEHDDLADPAARDAPPRAQNPHMHLYEAALQAFETTGNAVWLDRAQTMRAKGLEYFFDADSGTITEFIAPDLSILPGRDGQRREIGHQCEWAWLLLREIELGGDASMQRIAARLLSFADAHGFAQDGVMQGAAFDAVSADASWQENTFLLWPQTEAIKVYAVRSKDPAHGAKARALVETMFRQYFEGRSAYANQMDAAGKAIWPDALSRLSYHTVLALTEGARAGLWEPPQ